MKCCQLVRFLIEIRKVIKAESVEKQGFFDSEIEQTLQTKRIHEKYIKKKKDFIKYWRIMLLVDAFKSTYTILLGGKFK